MLARYIYFPEEPIWQLIRDGGWLISLYAAVIVWGSIIQKGGTEQCLFSFKT